MSFRLQSKVRPSYQKKVWKVRFRMSDLNCTERQAMFQYIRNGLHRRQWIACNGQWVCCSSTRVTTEHEDHCSTFLAQKTVDANFYGPRNQVLNMLSVGMIFVKDRGRLHTKGIFHCWLGWTSWPSLLRGSQEDAVKQLDGNLLLLLRSTMISAQQIYWK